MGRRIAIRLLLAIACSWAVRWEITTAGAAFSLSASRFFLSLQLWCGLSRPALRQLIFARAVQGAGGALLVPGSLAIISASSR